MKRFPWYPRWRAFVTRAFFSAPKPPSLYISNINKRKTYIQLAVLLAVFGTLIAWASMQAVQEQKAIDRMDTEADAYFDSIEQVRL